MFPIESFKSSLLKFVDILRRVGIPFHLTGGITGAACGEPRLAQDIDIVIENDSSVTHLETLIAELMLQSQNSFGLAREATKAGETFVEKFRSSKTEIELVHEIAKNLCLNMLLIEVIGESDEING